MAPPPTATSRCSPPAFPQATHATTQRNAPVAVAGLPRAVSVTAGNHDTLVLLADGSARGWGLNTSG